MKKKSWLRMRVSLFVFVGMISFTFQAKALDLKIGVFGGLNLSNRAAWADETYKGIAVPMAGISLEMALGNKLALNIQPSFLKKGYQHGEGEYVRETYVYYIGWQRYESSWPTDYKESLSYIEIPVLMKFYLGGKGIRPYIIAGPSIGLLVGATTEERYGQGGNNKEYVDSMDSNQKIDFSMVAGAGISVPIGNIFVFSEIKYCLEILGLKSEKNNGAWLTVGASFPL